jgi:DHA2 family multidrug resistance protein-like MFS transporter
MSSVTLSARGRWLRLIVICLSFLPVTIDATILYVAIPALVKALDADALELLWIVDIYPFVTAGLVLLTGPLGDRFGHQRILLAGLSVFGLASLLAAFATSAEMLIIARAIKGAGGAMIVPSSLALIRILFDDPRERSIGIGLWGALASVGAASGPLLGGLLLNHFWWGSVFLVNLPVVLVLSVMLILLVPNRALGFARRIDFLTPLLGLTGVLSMTYVLKLAAHGNLDPATGIVAGLYGLVALTVFVRRELRDPHPLLDLRLFAIPVFRAASVLAITTSMVLIGFELLLAEYLQMAAGLSPLAAGLAVLPFPVAGVLFGPVGGYLNDRAGMTFTASLGISCSIAGYLGLLAIDLSAISAPLLAMVGLIGIGHTMSMATATNSIMASAPEQRAGAAAAIESVCFELGAGFGIAALGSLLTAIYIRRFALPSGITADVGHSIGEALNRATTLPAAQAEALVHAARIAFVDGFRSAILFVAVVLTVLLVFILRQAAKVRAASLAAD